MNRLLFVGLLFILSVFSIFSVSAQADIELNKTVCQRYFDEYWALNNYDADAELFTEDFVSHNPFGGDMDAPALRDYVQGIFDGSPDMVVEPGVIIAEGEWVATTFYMEGTSTNEWAGLAPTGDLWSVNGITIHRMEDGKIAEEWSYMDTMNLMQQIDAAPYPGPLDSPPMQARMDILFEDVAPDDAMDLIDGWVGSLAYPTSAIRIFNDDVVVHEPLAFFPQDIVGRRTVVNWIGSIRQRMPDFTLVAHPDPEELVVIREGNLALIMGELQFNFTQEVSGIPPNDAFIRVPVVDLFRFEDNKIAEVWIRYDTMGWMSQMTAS